VERQRHTPDADVVAVAQDLVAELLLVDQRRETRASVSTTSLWA
jgi:hypothetical protein